MSVQERKIVFGEPYDTDVGRFVVERVDAKQLPPHRLAHEKQDAITYAKGLAMGRDLKVIDVCSASYQKDDHWIVELQVAR